MSSRIRHPFALRCLQDGTVLRGEILDPDGRGPLGIFLHGFRSSGHGHKADALFAHAHTRGYAWLGFDLRGHGVSDGSLSDLRLSLLVADIEAVLAAFAPRPVLLVGSSLGGWLAVLIALARPEQVRGLLLIAPAFNFIQQYFGRLPATELERWRTEIYRSFADPDGNGSVVLDYDVLADAVAHDIFQGPLTLSCPVAVLHGANDEAVPVEQSQRFMDVVSAPAKALWVVPEGDHRLHAGLPDLLAILDRLWVAAFTAGPSCGLTRFHDPV